MPPTCNGTITTCDSPTPNSPCEDCSTECKEIIPTSCVLYNGVNLDNIGIVTNTYLNEVLESLDTSVDPCLFDIVNAVTQYNNGAVPCGVFILKQNIVGSANNLMLGYGADTNIGGTNNTFLGINSGATVGTMTGVRNVAVGEDSLNSITSGLNNTCIGYLSGDSTTFGYGNTCIGRKADVARGAVNYGIGLGAYSTTDDNTCVIGGNDGIGDGFIRKLHIGSMNYAGTGSSICTDVEISITGWETGIGNTDLNGLNLILKTGASTGTGLPGYFEFLSSTTNKVSSDDINGLDGTTYKLSTAYQTTNATPVFIPMFFFGGGVRQFTFNLTCHDINTNDVVGATFISTWKYIASPSQIGVDDILSNNSNVGLTVTFVSDDDGTNVGVTITGEIGKTLNWTISASIN